MDLGELAKLGATTLVTAMSTNVWELVRSGFARLFKRGDEREQTELEAELERSRGELIKAGNDELAAAELRGELRGRLLQLLHSNPALADELRALVAEAAPRVEGQTPINQHAVADRGGSVIQAGGNIQGVSVRGSQPER